MELAQNCATQWAIVVTVNPLLHAGQRKLIDALLTHDKQLALIGGGFPGEHLPEDVRIAVAAYWTAPAALRAAGMAILGEIKCRGKVPV